MVRLSETSDVAVPGTVGSRGGASPQASVQTLTTAQRFALQTMILRHQRVRARLGDAQAVILDRLTSYVHRSLFRSRMAGHLQISTTHLVSRIIPGLSTQEVAALADYVLGGIAVLPAVGVASSGSSGSQSGLLTATRQMQETQMSFNLQYLQLLSRMQSENRSYTAVSNIMKTKHDTVKNSISNIH